jgi:hypothetical protein
MRRFAPAVNLLDALLAATSASGDTVPLTEREVRDNLLAILINGHDGGHLRRSYSMSSGKASVCYAEAMRRDPVGADAMSDLS